MSLTDVNSNQSVLIAAAVVILTTSSIWLKLQSLSYRPRKANIRSYEGWEQIQLSPYETTFAFLQVLQGISTLTWYDGDIEQVHQSLLLDKLAKVCQANPWLTGRLIRTGNSSSDVSMVYPNKEVSDKNSTINGSIFQVLTSSAGISRDTPYSALPRRLDQLGCLIGPGNSLVDKDECFFKVRLIPDCNRPNEKFALVVSLSHCVGDGHTFYQLHNMLSKDAPARALDPTRHPNIHDDIATALGGKEYIFSNPSLGFISRFLRGIILSKLFGPPTKVELLYINQEWIQKEKEFVTNAAKESSETNSSVSYVSTNDIVTSRFLQLSNTDQGTMAINFRGKIPGCTSDMAGNYFNQLICRDRQPPAQIRSSLQEICKAAGTRKQPTFSKMKSWEHMTSRQLYAFTSNWSTFYRPVHIKGCQQDIHVPVIPCDSRSAPARFVTALSLFRPSCVTGKQEQEVAALFVGSPKMLETLKQSGMMGPNVQ